MGGGGVAQAGADANARDEGGYAPLHYAAAVRRDAARGGGVGGCGPAAGAGGAPVEPDLE